MVTVSVTCDVNVVIFDFFEWLLNLLESVRLETVDFLREYIVLVVAWVWSVLIGFVALLIDYLRRGWRRLQGL